MVYFRLVFNIYLFGKRLLKEISINYYFSGLVLAIFLCGIRSPIGALFVTLIVFLGLTHKVKLMLQIGLLGGLAYFILSMIPEMNSYVGSIFSDDKSNVSGSSLDMRLTQLEGCFHEIRNNPIFGKGYSWDTYYIQNMEIIRLFSHLRVLHFLFFVMEVFRCIDFLYISYKVIQKNITNLQKRGSSCLCFNCNNILLIVLIDYR